MKVTKGAVLKLLKKWRPRLGLDGRWAIEIAMCFAKEAWPEDEAGNCAFVEVHSAYFQAKISLNVTAIESIEEPLEDVIKHELVHIVLDQLATVVRDTLGERHDATYRILLEQATETISRALV
jgi:hypothetical protein